MPKIKTMATSDSFFKLTLSLVPFWHKMYRTAISSSFCNLSFKSQVLCNLSPKVLLYGLISLLPWANFSFIFHSWFLARKIKSLFVFAPNSPSPSANPKMTSQYSQVHNLDKLAPCPKGKIVEKRMVAPHFINERYSRCYNTRTRQGRVDSVK